MSKTNVDRFREITQTQVGTYIKVDAGPKYDAKGQLIEPVKYHKEPYPAGTAKLRVMTEQRLSNATPGFQNPKRVGMLVPLAFSYKKYELKHSSGFTWNYRPGTNTIAPEDSYIMTEPNMQIPTDGYGLTAAEISALDRKAVVALRNKIKGMSFNAAQAVAERRNTARTVADAAKTIAKAVAAVKRGDVVGAAKALGVQRPRSTRQSRTRNVADAAAHHWLALQYGWKPLLNDCYGAAEQMAKAHNNVQFKTVRHRTSQSAEPKTRTVYAVSPPWTGYDAQRSKISEKCDIQYGVTFSQGSATAVNLKELGITNPALLAWELLPFSFVADWFLPIGNFLSSLDATVGLSFHSGYKTTFRRINGEAIWDTMTKTNDGRFMSRYIQNNWERVECTREKLSGFPSVAFPPFKNPVSVSHAVTAVALLHQLFKR